MNDVIADHSNESNRTFPIDKYPPPHTLANEIARSYILRTFKFLHVCDWAVQTETSFTYRLNPQSSVSCTVTIVAHLITIYTALQQPDVQ